MARPDATTNLPPAVCDLAEQIGHLPGVRRVLLFGSRARGDHRPMSDVDLAVDADATPTARLAALDLVDDAETLLPIDLVWLPEATPALRAEVQREGIVLFDSTSP